MKIQLALVLVATSSLSFHAAAQAPLHTLHGATAGGRLGQSVAWLDDVDGDGVRDYAVGAPLELIGGVERGVVRVLSGSTGAVLRTFLGVLDGEEFGASVAGIADRNGDGVGEILIGAPKNDFQYVDRGAAYMYSPVTGSMLLTYRGSVEGDELGFAVANVGDLNADGIDDYAVGLPGADGGSANDAGRISAFSGATGTGMYPISSADTGARFGSTLAAAGDFDGDGYGDFVVGAPGYTGVLSHQGRAIVVSGHTGATLKTWNGPFAGAAFGTAACSLGDLDGDGKSEIVIGAPLASAGGVERGRVLFFHGGTGAYQFGFDGLDGWRYGAALACIGDWNGNGSRDIAVGAPGTAVFSVGTFGAIRVHDGSNGALLTTVLGYAQDGELGSALAGTELNGDGIDDLLVGAPLESQLASDGGSARVLVSGASKPYAYCTAKTNSLACAPKIAFSGAPSLSLADNFHITASDVIGQKAGMVFWGLAQANAPYHGGTFCVAPPVVRTLAQNAGGTSAACDGAYDFHFSRAHMLAYGLTAGTIGYAQYWMRDPGFAHPDNVAFTNALRFQIAP